jgi:hypothetical protein
MTRVFTSARSLIQAGGPQALHVFRMADEARVRDLAAQVRRRWRGPSMCFVRALHGRPGPSSLASSLARRGRAAPYSLQPNGRRLHLVLRLPAADWTSHRTRSA